MGLGAVVKGVVGVGFVYRVVESALAHSMGLQILRHGTPPLACYGIWRRGGDPQCSTLDPQAFFVVKDQFREEDGSYVLPPSDIEWFNRYVDWTSNDPRLFPLNKRAISWSFAGEKGAKIWGRWAEERGVPKLPFQIFGGVVGFLTPTLHFHIQDEEVYDRFYPSPTLEPAALCTQQLLGPEYLGLRGIWCQGVNRNIWKRIKANPGRFAVGMLQFGGLMWVTAVTMQRYNRWCTRIVDCVRPVLSARQIRAATWMVGITTYIASC